MIIVVSSIGQTANRLKHFAHLIAFAADHDVKLVNLAFDKYADLFALTASDLFCRYPARKSGPRPLVRFLRHAIYLGLRGLAECGLLRLVPGTEWISLRWNDPEDYDLGSDEFRALLGRRPVLFLGGSYKHRYQIGIEKHQNEIRRQFQLVPEHREAVEKHAANVRAGADVVVGVHMRQGDNKTDTTRVDYFETPGYVAVMRRMVELLPGRKVHFMVCSDRKQDSKDFGNLKVFFGPGPFVQDMYALAECDYIIGAGQSTFSEWASFMARKPFYPLFDPKKPFQLDDFSVAEL